MLFLVSRDERTQGELVIVGCGKLLSKFDCALQKRDSCLGPDMSDLNIHITQLKQARLLKRQKAS